MISMRLVLVYLPVSAILSTYKIVSKEVPSDNIFDAVSYCQSKGGKLPILRSTNEALGFVEASKLHTYYPLSHQYIAIHVLKSP